MAVGGMTYEQIAHTMGYANRGTVHRIVQQALRQREAQDLEQVLELELERLDALQASVWEGALKGDVNAAGVVLKVMDRRCRLLGLYPDSRQGRTASPCPTPVLVDPAELVACEGWPPADV